MASEEAAYDGGPEQVAQELAANGYYALIASYRLAPCGRIEGQQFHDTTQAGMDSGRPPQQSDDVKALVRAARADSHCKNQKVGIIGGSAGGTHAVWVALDKTPTPNNDWPHWCQGTLDDRVVCAVGLSGAYDLADRSNPGYESITQFANDVENYTNSCDPSYQRIKSPVSLVATPTQDKPFKPIYVINSINDPMPYSQTPDMLCALENANIDSTLYQVLTIPGTDHAFSYWHNWDDQDPTHRVSDDVLAFLAKYLKAP